MKEFFYVGAYWGSRKERLQEIVDKGLRTLQVLGEIDEHFLKWYDTGTSRKQALQNRVEMNENTIEKIVVRRIKKGDLEEGGFAANGFLFSLWTGHIDEESSSITFSVGNTFDSDHLTNSCVITIPFEGAARDRLLQIEKARKIIVSLVEIWTPDYSVLTSPSLNSMLNVVNDIGWITYRKAIKRVPSITDQIVYEKRTSGHWFYITTSNYSNALGNELQEIKVVL